MAFENVLISLLKKSWRVARGGWGLGGGACPGEGAARVRGRRGTVGRHGAAGRRAAGAGGGDVPTTLPIR